MSHRSLPMIRAAQWMLALTIGVAATACRSVSLTDPILGDVHKPSNVHRAVEELPKQLKRVAILPVAPANDSPDLAHGAEMLQSEIENHLIESGRFEVVRVPQEKMRSWTGQESWSAEDKLPPGFFKPFREDLGCDAILFCRLTAYHGYEPVRVGWRMKLVDTQDFKIWWSADEMFDSGRPEVVNAARLFSKKQLNPVTSDDSRAILSSPSRFARYTLQSLFATLPRR